jgi:hypothetical protein
MKPERLVASLDQEGYRMSAEGDRVRIFHPDHPPPEDVVALVRAHRVELASLLAHAEGQIRWRAEAMRPQVPPTGPIPFLVARRPLHDAPGTCLSCGDPLDTRRRFRCGPCVHAVERVLNEVRE